MDSHGEETLRTLESQGNHHAEFVSSLISVNPAIRLKRIGKQAFLFSYAFGAIH